jgi:hypothetical protein
MLVRGSLVRAGGLAPTPPEHQVASDFDTYIEGQTERLNKIANEARYRSERMQAARLARQGIIPPDSELPSTDGRCGRCHMPFKQLGSIRVCPEQDHCLTCGTEFVEVGGATMCPRCGPRCQICNELVAFCGKDVVAAGTGRVHVVCRDKRAADERPQRELEAREREAEARERKASENLSAAIVGVVLCFLAGGFGWLWATVPTIQPMALLLGCALLYCLPAIIATGRGCRRAFMYWLLNVTLGWTLIMWAYLFVRAILIDHAND